MTTNDAGIAGGSSLEASTAASDEVARIAHQYLGTGPDAGRLAQQRARLLHWEQDRRRERPVWLVPLVWGAGVAACAACVAWLTLSLDWNAVPPKLAEQRPVATAVPSGSGETEASGVAQMAGALSATLAGRELSANAWVNAERGPLTVAFSDSSRVSLTDGSRARLVVMDQRHVRFTVESGELNASVTPNGSHVWVFAAGPYNVTVLGTVLQVTWEPKSERLGVAVSRGKVQVSGGQIDGEGRLVAAGESFSISPPSLPGVDDAVSSETSAPAATDSVIRRSRSGAKSPELRATHGVSADSLPAPRAAGSWKGLAERAEYKRALEAAEAQGMDALMASAGAADLLLLADAARLAGATNRATVVLQALRRRYPGHANANVAAFTLGRMAYEVLHDDRRAAHWFRTYLAAAPSGPLAEAARGRLMLSLSRAGDRPRAVEAADSYLAEHPRGSYAKAARSLLSKR